jgi:hypothetical protein
MPVTILATPARVPGPLRLVWACSETRVSRLVDLSRPHIDPEDPAGWPGQFQVNGRSLQHFNLVGGKAMSLLTGIEINTLKEMQWLKLNPLGWMFLAKYACNGINTRHLRFASLSRQTPS